MEMVSITISIAASIVSGTVLFLLKRFFKRRDETEAKHAEAKKQENILILKSIKAIGELTQANSIAIRDGKTNGELKHALADYEKVDAELYDFLIDQNTAIN